MTTKLKPMEYLTVWEQTGIEPSLDQLSLPLVKNPTTLLGQLKSLSIYFSDTLSYAFKNYPFMISQVFNSNLSCYLKKYNEQDFSFSISSGTLKENVTPWFDAVVVSLSLRLPFSHEATTEIFKYIKNNFDFFKSSKCTEGNTPQGKNNMCELLLSLHVLVASIDARKLCLEESLHLQQNEQLFEEVFDLCSLEEKEKFLKSAVSRFCDKKMFSFLIKKVKENPSLNLTEPSFYYDVVAFVGGPSSSPQCMADALRVLSDNKMRNDTISRSIVFLAERVLPSLADKNFPQSREQFFSCLTPQDKDLIIENLKVASLDTKSWPQTFKNHLEKKEIKNSIKKTAGSLPSSPTKKM